MNSDLIDRGYSRRDIATVLSWSDLRDIIDHRKHDSALSRALDPDGWYWNDIGAQLAAKSATALSSLRFWDLMRMGLLEDLEGDALAEYLPAEYGPSASASPDGGQAESTEVEDARAVAESLRS